MDLILKRESDHIRTAGDNHEPTSLDPILESLGMKPFAHGSLDSWRKNFDGVQYVHPKTKMKVSGALDDLWTLKAGGDEVFVVDFKATAKAQLPAKLENLLWPEYKRQAEIYQWLLRKNGLNVSNRSFFVFAIADNTVDRFNHSLEFSLCVVEYEGNDDWIEGVLEKIHQCPTIEHQRQATQVHHDLRLTWSGRIVISVRNTRRQRPYRAAFSKI